VASTKSREARGYGTAHQREKRRLNPIIERDGAMCCARRCLMPSREIPPGTKSHEWDLGHSLDRTRWTGPEHPRCNRSEGATRGNQARGKAKATPSRWLL
jgi:hypothetical protein